MSIKGWTDSVNQTLINRAIIDGAAFQGGKNAATKLGASPSTATKVGVATAVVTDIAVTHYNTAQKVNNTIKSGAKAITNYISNEISRVKAAGNKVSSQINRK